MIALTKEQFMKKVIEDKADKELKAIKNDKNYYGYQYDAINRTNKSTRKGMYRK